MTIQDLLNLVQETVPHTMSDDILMGHLNDIETIIHRDIFLAHVGPDMVQFNGYGAHTPVDTPLLLSAPHHQVYRWYLEMQIHLANQETGRYNNAAIQYNNAFQAMADYYNREYRPKGVRSPRYW